MDSLQSNSLSVSELAQQISEILNYGFSAAVTVEGEISNFSASQRGHWYFTLKDEQAQMRAVMFKGSNSGLPTPQDGDHIQVIAEVSFYQNRGDCQLICKFMTAKGIGALLAKIERLKKSLANEGLFDSERKKSIPLYPKYIGIVTSKNAAALQDMLKIFREYQSPVQIFIFPAQVQGADAGRDLTEKLSQAVHFIVPSFEKSVVLASPRRLDAIIVSRGGGSSEDLMEFSDENLVRTIASSPIPIITGIGHETDLSLSDLAADIHQPTPTAAASVVCIQCKNIYEYITYISEDISRISENSIQELYASIAQFTPQELLHTIYHSINNTRQSIDRLMENMEVKIHQTVEDLRHRVVRYTESIEASSPSKTLDRGFVLIRNVENDALITDTTATFPSQEISITFRDGKKYAIMK